jgi:hypothetical protein
LLEINDCNVEEESVTAFGRKFEFIGKEAAIDHQQRLNGS